MDCCLLKIPGDTQIWFVWGGPLEHQNPFTFLSVILAETVPIIRIFQLYVYVARIVI